MTAPSAPERFAAAAGALARESRWFADRRVLRRLGQVRRAIKADHRPCPDDPRGRSFAEIFWSPNAWWCERFYWQLRRERPARTLEVGTSLGLTGLYVLGALERNRHGHFFTIELAPTKVVYARQLFAAFGDTRATCLEGRSEAVLPALLDREPLLDWAWVDIDHRYDSTMSALQLLADHIRPGGTLLFDDINFSDEMRRAWAEIRQLPGFEWTTLHFRDRGRLAPRMGMGRRR